ncbi:NADH-quinone oxidoreductase subunit M [Hallerella succinigenes]|uniref:complex I subunit 4 family protein n=1 Tax=Hallerella succinigenes TaxID=1896222 RepID=UPI002A80C445|nr:NADH-quinone oxidoreductase subunit M [Hallerella succinigenes]MDY5028166.1 NADH-quinone oxidoreductase subunit M [Hallerella succinigenes]
MLYALVFAPFLAALLMVAASGKDARSASRLAVILAATLFCGSLKLLLAGDYNTTPREWFTIPGAGITVTLSFAVKGFSAWMVFLANIITLAALISARKTTGGNYRNFAIGMFALLGALNGTFLASDAVLFFFFFEALVLPAAILIGSYGGPERREAAANFALYTLIGSAPMAVALWYLISIAGSSDVLPVAQAAQALPESTQTILFWCFAAAFWVKTPLFPLHGWQAETYAEAPASLSAVLTGAMSKAGVYGFYFWVIEIFPKVAFKNGMLLLGFGLLTAVYGAFMAMRAKDIKKLLAFSSMGHLGLAVAGIFTLNVEVFPAVLVMLVGHGLSASALFILSGSAERFAGHRCLDKMGGFASRYPVFGFFFGVASILAIAIPGTAGFVGEFLVLLGLWGVSKVAAVVAGLCIILTGVYMLRLIQKVLFGEPGEISEDQKKLRFPIADAVATAPLLILLIVFGVFPLPITSSLDYTRVTEDQQEEIEAAIEAASQPAAVAEMTEQVSAEPVSADTAAVEAQVVTEAEEKAVAETATAEQEVKQVEAEDVR